MWQKNPEHRLLNSPSPNLNEDDPVLTKSKDLVAIALAQAFESDPLGQPETTIRVTSTVQGHGPLEEPEDLIYKPILSPISDVDCSPDLVPQMEEDDGGGATVNQFFGSNFSQNSTQKNPILLQKLSEGAGEGGADGSKNFVMSSPIWDNHQSNFCYQGTNGHDDHHHRLSVLSSQHKQQHQRDWVKCSYCPKYFETIGGKNVHERIHKLSNDELFKCFICQKKFARRCALTSHLTTHRSSKQQQFQEELTTCPGGQKQNLVDRGQRSDFSSSKNKRPQPTHAPPLLLHEETANHSHLFEKGMVFVCQLCQVECKNYYWAVVHAGRHRHRL